jgi:hypothetical protein
LVVVGYVEFEVLGMWVRWVGGDELGESQSGIGMRGTYDADWAIVLSPGRAVNFTGKGASGTVELEDLVFQRFAWADSSLTRDFERDQKG